MNDEAKAIFMNATGSQDMGYGIASALFGISSPAGRVPMTWYKSDDDLPDITDYDLINNKRTYRYFDNEVLYPFGYGLTYTRFSYENINVKKYTDINENALLSEENTQSLIHDSILDIEVNIKNIGNAVSDEVIQVYIKRISESMTVHPLRRLIGFERIHNVLPGETETVKLCVKPTDLSIYSESLSAKIVEPGEYLIYAGANALDEQVSLKIVI